MLFQLKDVGDQIWCGNLKVRQLFSVCYFHRGKILLKSNLIFKDLVFYIEKLGRLPRVD
jgi:hypothetical protein